ncbi:MAG: SRPBCC family protein [Nitrosopumilaceae archaeon]
MTSTKRFQSAFVKKSTIIHTSSEEAWKTISNITNLPDWIPIIKKTVLKSKIRKGVGAVRMITLEDDSILEEHIVDWRKGDSFSYIAVSGLPVRAYFATLSIKRLDKKSVRLTWSGYISSRKMTIREFKKMIYDFNSLYKVSVRNLKSRLER